MPNNRVSTQEETRPKYLVDDIVRISDDSIQFGGALVQIASATIENGVVQYEWIIPQRRGCGQEKFIEALVLRGLKAVRP